MPGCSRAAQFWPTLGDSRSRRYRAVVWHNDGLFRKRGCLLEVRGACALGNEREKWAAHTWTCLRDETGQNEALCTVGRGGEVERKARGAETGSEREAGALRGRCAARAHHTRQRARAQGAQGAHSGSAQGAQHRSAQGAQHRSAQGAQHRERRVSALHGPRVHMAGPTVVDSVNARSPGLSPQNL